MIAPLIPTLAHEFSTSDQKMGFIIPAYMLTYGFSTLFYGPLSDRIGRKIVLLILLALSVITTFCCSLAHSAESLIALRIASGLCAGGILPISLALIGDLYPFQKIGRPMGWMFGAVAGGLSFGSTLGAWLNPSLGWRNEFVGLAFANAIVFVLVWRRRHQLIAHSVATLGFFEVFKVYFSLIKNPKGARTYSLIFLNGVFHSGVFSWLGLYFTERYHLSDEGIGKALLGYGLPGMFLGPILGRLADQFGRDKIIPMGFLIAALCAYCLIPISPLWVPVVAVTLLSVGFDMSHPLLAGIVTTLDPNHRGQAMGFNAFAVFTGFGFGALAFQFLLPLGLPITLAIFATLQMVVPTFWFRSAS
jgi:predicted MFS family arabinose efflux permease